MEYVVYRHLDLNKNILYIGKTKSLNTRTNQHMRDSNWRFDIIYVEYIKFKTKIEMDIAELYLINKYSPNNNKKDNRGDFVEIVNIIEKWEIFNVNIQPKKDTLVFKPKYIKSYKEQGFVCFDIKTPIKKSSYNIDELSLYYLINDKNKQHSIKFYIDSTVITFHTQEIKHYMSGYNSINSIGRKIEKYLEVLKIDINSIFCSITFNNEYLNKFINKNIFPLDFY